MRYPEFLPENGTIGFLAPSFGCAIQPYHAMFLHALEVFEEKGYQTLVGPNCFASEGVGISNTPQKCAEEVNAMFSSDADCLFSVGGGELMCEILPYVDFEALAQNQPKWFMGYSDNTNLIYLLATLADTAAVYAPCASTFGTQPWHPSLQDALDIVTGRTRTVSGYGLWEKEKNRDEEHPLAPYHVTEPLQLRTFIGMEETDRPVDFTGRLIGGCMDCLVTLLGTRFDRTADFLERYREDGFIWMLEACDLNVFSIRRAMWQMEQAGWFRYVKGFLIGRPLNGEPMFDLDAYGAVLAAAGKLNVPVIMDIDLGHLPPMMPLVVGSIAHVSVSGNDIRISMEYR